MKSEIEMLIPHRRSMVLLDRVLSVDSMRAQAEVQISSESLFAEANGIPSYVGLEYLAQAVAVYGSQQIVGEAPKVGFLLGARKYRSEISHFPIGKSLEVEVKPVAQNGDIGSYVGTIHLDGKLIAEGSLTILVRDSL